MPLRSCGLRIMILPPPVFVGLQLALLAFAFIMVAAPHIGLGENEQFVLYRLFGVKRLEAYSALCWLILLSWFYQVIAFAFTRHLARRSISAGGRSLFAKTASAAARREYVHAGILALFFLGLFRVLSTRALGAISGQADQHYHQAFIDYDIDWNTPIFAPCTHACTRARVRDRARAFLSHHCWPVMDHRARLRIAPGRARARGRDRSANRNNPRWPRPHRFCASSQSPHAPAYPRPMVV
jgi:hypothetical protein